MCVRVRVHVRVCMYMYVMSYYGMCSWYTEQLKYTAQMLQSQKEKELFLSSMLLSWQEYLGALFEDNGDITDNTGYY